MEQPELAFVNADGRQQRTWRQWQNHLLQVRTAWHMQNNCPNDPQPQPVVQQQQQQQQQGTNLCMNGVEEATADGGEFSFSQ
jgi:hypothetical protein